MLTPLRRALVLTVGLVAVIALPAHAEGPTADQIVGNMVNQGAAYVISVQALEGQAIAFVQGLQAQEAEQTRQEALRALQKAPVVSQPSGSYQALANCEQGGRNSPYFGYFSIMDGSAAGKSWDEQVQMVQAIKARAGAGAWDGCARYVP